MKVTTFNKSHCSRLVTPVTAGNVWGKL